MISMKTTSNGTAATFAPETWAVDEEMRRARASAPFDAVATEWPIFLNTRVPSLRFTALSGSVGCQWKMCILRKPIENEANLHKR